MASQRFVETTLTCCVCGAHAATHWRTASDHILGSAERFQAVKCARCGTVRLDPRPPAEAMAAYYSPTTYARAESDEDTGLADRLDEYNRRLADRTDRATASNAPRRALDVGCGDGRFLAALASLGWEVEGLETDPVAAALARKRTGGTIHEVPLEDLALPGGTFGLISLLHVLEHVPDPRDPPREPPFQRIRQGPRIVIEVLHPNGNSNAGRARVEQRELWSRFLDF